MIFRNLIFEPEVVKQRLRAGMVSHHEQQASKYNGEQQHRVLWPAYNSNIAPPQASTEGLFQQTRLLTSTIGHNPALSQSFEILRARPVCKNASLMAMGCDKDCGEYSDECRHKLRSSTQILRTTVLPHFSCS